MNANNYSCGLTCQQSELMKINRKQESYNEQMQNNLKKQLSQSINEPF